MAADDAPPAAGAGEPAEAPGTPPPEAETGAGASRAGRVLDVLLQLGERARSGLAIEGLARLQKAAYFAWNSAEVDEFGADARFSAAVDPLLEVLYTLWWRVETSGLERIPADGPALLVANHSGVLPYDGLMIKLAVRRGHPRRRDCRLLALDMFALLPFLAPMLAKSGAVRAHPDNAERLLRAGELVGVFPEGVKGVGKRFRDRYRLARFGRGGFVRVALRTGAPIVPCAVVGAEEIHPVLAKADWVGRPFGLPYFPITPTFPLLGPLGLVPLPTKWSIEFADPIDVSGYGAEAADDPIVVGRLSEEVRAAIQRMLDERLARRASVFLG
jgi:1-acyl-sn-glycerol-3-phosphate acyltransferase